MNLPTLLHSVSYSGSWGQAQLSVEDFINRAADLGYSGVMLMAKRPHVSLLDYDDTTRDRVCRQIEERGLTKVCLAGYNNFTADLEHGEVPTREIQIHYVTELARLARDLGGELVRIYTGYEKPGRKLPAAVESDRRVAERMRPAGSGIRRDPRCPESSRHRGRPPQPARSDQRRR